MSGHGGEIRALTGARGAAACWVMVYHTAYAYPPDTPLGRLIHHGYLAVDFFFLLSGFVLAHTYGDKFVRGADLAVYRDFLWKRFARVYPLYFVATLVAAVLMRGGYLGPLHAFYRNLPGNLLLVQAWHTDFGSIVGPGWSISCELLAYLLFPLFCAAVLFARPSRALAALALAAASLVALAHAPDRWIAEPGFRAGPLDIWVGSTFGPLLRCLAEFAIGVGVCRIRRSRAARFLAGESWVWPAPAALAIVALSFPGTDLFVLVMFTVLIFGLSWDRGVVAWVLGSGPIYFLGVISYSIYLLHFPILAGIPRVMQMMPGFPHGMLRAVFAWAVILVASTMAYRLVEAPGRRLIGGWRPWNWLLSQIR